MAQATSLTVLSSVTALGADVTVGTNGYVNISGAPAFKARSLSNITITTSVAEQLQIDTVTFATLTSGADYNLSFKCFDTVSGNPVIVPVTVTATAATAAVIAAQVVAAFNAFGSNLSVVASVSTDYAVFTAKTGFPAFLTAYYDSKMTVALSTAAIAGVGKGSALQTKWNTSAGFYTAGIYAQSANIVATTFYTQVMFTLASGAEVNLLVAESTTVAATPTITNYYSLCGAYGSIGSLQKGYRAVIVALGANVGVSSGVATRASGDFITEKLRTGDALMVGSVSGTVIQPYADATNDAALLPTKALVDMGDVSAAAGYVTHLYALPI